MSIQEFLQELKHVGYHNIILYTEELQVKFIELSTLSQRRPFLIYISAGLNFRSKEVDHLLEKEESNYKNYRQREYLEKIKLETVACLSNHNICLKLKENIFCYAIDSIDIVSDNDVSEKDDLIDADIMVDDYSVHDIYPVFHIKDFMTRISIFEDIVLQNYEIITKAEEEMNETEVESLLSMFEKQKTKLKDTIYQLHCDAYNTRRDIFKVGKNLAEIYAIKNQSETEKDRTRFRIERLAKDTEDKIDSLNKNLRQKRNDADLLLKRYRQHLEQLSLVNID
jgi:hypothetical protein